MKFLCAFLASLLVTVAGLAQDNAGISQSEFRQELLAIQEADQAARQPYNEETPPAVDARHTARLKEIIDAHGWPTISMVGKECQGTVYYPG